MYIDRYVVAELLKTKITNIRHFKQIENKVYIKLWDSEDKVSITVQEYQECLQGLKQNKKNTDGVSFGMIMMTLGIFILIFGYSMDTTVSSDGDSYYNIGLMDRRNNTIQLGGIALIAGTIMYCLSKKENN